MNYKLFIIGMISGSERIIVMFIIVCILIFEFFFDFVVRVYSYEGIVYA